ncbi:deSI-like protein At4g17486 isoform X2 [Hibiscus syriacus]|uniref:deSI-like protein At4g17486 isoform X2 n=1 Tax=Hibiscus syriacus TaxID=106335 RepID=UPI001921EC65|nr:deSI-like protein At4g17486 isoform X2 [Hibiscus syriacus]
MLCRKNSSCVETGSVPVYLNVYDLTPMNGYAYWFGLGVYHSGVQVHGIEYAFGAHEYPTTGIFEAEPKQCEGFSFRKSILIGKTELGPMDVRGIMEDLAEEYKGNAYNLITKNCNHFCNDACIRLTGNPIPSWVNRLARIVRHHRIEDKSCEGEKKKLTNDSNRFTSSSTSSSNSSPSITQSQTRGRSRSRRSLPPSSPLILGPSSS